MELNKSTLRYLALGFFASGVLLSGYGMLSSSTSSLSAEEQSYKEMYEELLAEESSSMTSVDQKNETSEESEAASSEEIAETDTAKETTSNEDVSEEEQSETTEENQETSSDAVTTTIVIAEGDPSSFATNQLQNQGIIESASEFNDFLEENGYTVRLRPGSYEVSSDMTFQEIATILMDEN